MIRYLIAFSLIFLGVAAIIGSIVFWQPKLFEPKSSPQDQYLYVLDTQKYQYDLSSDYLVMTILNNSGQKTTFKFNKKEAALDILHEWTQSIIPKGIHLEPPS